MRDFLFHYMDFCVFIHFVYAFTIWMGIFFSFPAIIGLKLSIKRVNFKIMVFLCCLFLFSIFSLLYFPIKQEDLRKPVSYENEKYLFEVRESNSISVFKKEKEEYKENVKKEINGLTVSKDIFKTRDKLNFLIKVGCEGTFDECISKVDKNIETLIETKSNETDKS